MTSIRAIDRLRALPLSERFSALEELVVSEFKVTLLMTEDEELPLGTSFFDLGFTSLRVIEIKDRLEYLLDCEISANVLFNRPTVTQLLDHLTRDVLADVFEPGGVPGRSDEPVADEFMDSLLEDLYRS